VEKIIISIRVSFLLTYIVRLLRKVLLGLHNLKIWEKHVISHNPELKLILRSNKVDILPDPRTFGTQGLNVRDMIDAPTFETWGTMKYEDRTFGQGDRTFVPGRNFSFEPKLNQTTLSKSYGLNNTINKVLSHKTHHARITTFKTSKC
jgi:hypothetical protein